MRFHLNRENWLEFLTSWSLDIIVILSFNFCLVKEINPVTYKDSFIVFGLTIAISNIYFAVREVLRKLYHRLG